MNARGQVGHSDFSVQRGSPWRGVVPALFAIFSAPYWAVTAFSANIDAEKLAQNCRPAVMLVIGEQGGPRQTSQGTGFLVSADGHLVTNHHVIKGATRIVARSATGSVYPVKAILADDDEHDLAILQLDAANMPMLALGDENSVHPGAAVVVIGNPTGLEGSITEGIISAMRDLKSYGNVFQISAAISPGSSGSPVLNSDGKVLGVATFKKTDGEALNFAVSVKYLKALLAKPTPPRPIIPGTGTLSAAPDSAGVREEDQKVRRDPDYEKLKVMEAKHTYAVMIECAKNLAQKYPQSALAQRRLSDAYYYMDFLEDAVATCKVAIELDPANGRGWNDLALAYRRKKNEAAALTAYREGLKVAPADAKLWIEYGEMLEDSNPNAAVDAVHRAISLLKEGKGKDEESAEYALFSCAAQALQSLGKSDEAYDAALLGVRANPKEPDAWATMAEAALATKKYAHVRPYLEQAIGAGGTPEVLYAILADSEFEQGHVDLAYDALLRAYQANNSSPGILDRLIHFLMNNGNVQSEWENIQGYLRRLTELDPKLGKEDQEFIQASLKSRQQSGKR